MVITKNHSFKGKYGSIWSQIKKISSVFGVDNRYVLNCIFWKFLPGFRTLGRLKIVVQLKLVNKAEKVRKIYIETRKHSSGMRTARTVPYVLFLLLLFLVLVFFCFVFDKNARKWHETW